MFADGTGQTSGEIGASLADLREVDLTADPVGDSIPQKGPFLSPSCRSDYPMRWIRRCSTSLVSRRGLHVLALAAVIVPLSALLSSCQPAAKTRPASGPSEDSQPIQRVSQHRYSRLVGSRAADIDIKHWIHGGHAAVKPFRTFEPGKVYVLAFWASWCPYSREAIPLLASLQQAHAVDGLTVIAISDEPPAVVNAFIADTPGDEHTLADAARCFVLASDPDGSVFGDYMEEVSSVGIPTVFIVGRQGVIEWVGDPEDIEEPLQKVLADSWDRAEFANSMKRIEDIRAGAENIERLLVDGRAPDAVVAYAKLVAAHENDAQGLNEVAWLACELSRGQPLPEEFANAAIAAVQRGLDLEPDNGNSLDTLAHLQAMQGDLHAAISTQKRAVEHAGPFGKRIERYLQELESQKMAAE